MTTRDHSHS